MPVKSDAWIRRMAQSHGLIEPFEPNQVREVNGQKVISFGTSSYGYDIRCAAECRDTMTGVLGRFTPSATARYAPDATSAPACAGRG